MRIHHVGYLVKDIVRAIAHFELLGYILESDVIYDDYRGISICFMINTGYRIELVMPENESSVVSELRRKVGNSPYHICYEVENLEDTIQELKNQHFVLCQNSHEAVALGDRKVAFLINSQIGMIELLEANKQN